MADSKPKFGTPAWEEALERIEALEKQGKLEEAGELRIKTGIAEEMGEYEEEDWD
jgi:hypothetical protein